MKYMALIYSAEKTGPFPGTVEFDELIEAYQKAEDVFRKDGVFIGGEALNPVGDATSLRVRDGRTETMDGPFAETKEALGGYYVFDCADLDEAIRYAAMIPTAASGTIELRPIMSIEMAT